MLRAARRSFWFATVAIFVCLRFFLCGSHGTRVYLTRVSSAFGSTTIHVVVCRPRARQGRLFPFAHLMPARAVASASQLPSFFAPADASAYLPMRLPPGFSSPSTCCGATMRSPVTRFHRSLPLSLFVFEHRLTHTLHARQFGSHARFALPARSVVYPTAYILRGLHTNAEHATDAGCVGYAHGSLPRRVSATPVCGFSVAVTLRSPPGSLPRSCTRRNCRCHVICGSVSPATILPTDARSRSHWCHPAVVYAFTAYALQYAGCATPIVTRIAPSNA